MLNIRTYNQISDKGLNRFPSSYQISPQNPNADAVLLRSHKLAIEELESSVRAVARAGAGVNNVPVSQCTEHGIVVFNTPGANANAVKELVLTGMLLASRGMSGTDHVDGTRAKDAQEMP